MTAPWLQAQDVLVTLEAEKGIITLPAKVKPVDGSTVEGISGGKYVGDNDPGSSIVFNDVEVPEAGTYEFKTYYMSMQNRSIAVKVNNYSEYISTVSNTTPGWDVPPTNEMSTYIYMDKGKNTIKIRNHYNRRRASETGRVSYRSRSRNRSIIRKPESKTYRRFFRCRSIGRQIYRRLRLSR